MMMSASSLSRVTSSLLKSPSPSRHPLNPTLSVSIIPDLSACLLSLPCCARRCFLLFLLHLFFPPFSSLFLPLYFIPALFATFYRKRSHDDSCDRKIACFHYILSSLDVNRHETDDLMHRRTRLHEDGKRHVSALFRIKEKCLNSPCKAFCIKHVQITSVLA